MPMATIQSRGVTRDEWGAGRALVADAMVSSQAAPATKPMASEMRILRATQGQVGDGTLETENTKKMH